MAQLLDCSPLYEGRPDFEVSVGSSTIPSTSISRSRLFAGGTFFRSKLTIDGGPEAQSLDCNDISLEVTRPDPFADGIDLVVRFRKVEVERYSVTQVTNCQEPGDPPPPAGIGNNVAIPALRTATADSEYISMPARGSDAQDSMGEDAGCLGEFNDTFMSGGTGVAVEDLPNIKTGPERTIVFLTQFEDANGNPVAPPQSQRLIQYNYDTLVFVPYVPNASCRII